MSFCPNCGVEVQVNHKTCVLCDYDMLNVYTSKKPLNSDDNSLELFPEPEYNNLKKFAELRRNLFYALSMLIIVNLCYHLLARIFSQQFTSKDLYSIVFMVILWTYLFLASGIIKNNKAIITIVICNTLSLAFCLDLVYGGPGWFFPVFIMSVIWGGIVLIITASIVKIKKRKNRSGTHNTAIGLSIFIIGTEAVLSKYISQNIVLSWSLALSFQIMFFTLLYMFFRHKILAKLHRKLKMKIHF
ncbi:hypothetical protein CHISP_2898 [Chitinispirillum alkaliphilum]|nr:hypothetical protein CHISP_2898 [Chitinispirillum alkaliphilum]